MILVVGLGNPDNKYKNNVHNLGFMAIDRLAELLNIDFDKKGHKGVYTTLQVGAEKVVLLKPHTYMNLSGESIQSISSFYKIPPQNIIVLYDDIDIDIGSIRIREKGSSGTHNGMRSIVSCLGSTEFKRVRIGCKPVDFKGSLVDYVLSNLKSEDSDKFNIALDKAARAVYDFVKGDRFEIVMNKYNG